MILVIEKVGGKRKVVSSDTSIPNIFKKSIISFK